jgi:cyclopropane-fatty-acyl-phospholipid synthase
MGFSDRFIRMWEFYFCYCEAGFRERHIGDVQLLLEKN